MIKAIVDAFKWLVRYANIDQVKSNHKLVITN